MLTAISTGTALGINSVQSMQLVQCS